MQKFVHQSIWYHSSLIMFQVLSSFKFVFFMLFKMNEENKKNIESNLFWGDSNLPTFLKGDIPSNLTQPTNHQPISHGVSQRALASLSSATLAKSSLERVPGVPTKRRNVASFSLLPGAMGFCFVVGVKGPEVEGEAMEVRC